MDLKSRSKVLIRLLVVRLKLKIWYLQIKIRLRKHQKNMLAMTNYLINIGYNSKVNMIKK